MHRRRHEFVTGGPFEHVADALHLRVDVLPGPGLSARPATANHVVTQQPELPRAELRRRRPPVEVPQQGERPIEGLGMLGAVIVYCPAPVVPNDLDDRDRGGSACRSCIEVGWREVSPATLPLGNDAVVALAAFRRVKLAEPVIAPLAGFGVGQRDDRLRVAGPLAVRRHSWRL